MDSIPIQTVARWLADSNSTVAFTGAGISTESGIPDFRSPGGIWTRYRTVYFDEFLASAEARHEYWTQKAEGHADMARALPNVGHDNLARWEADGRLTAVITQNIDGLHQQSGSRRVLELHGTARQIGCLDCKARYEADAMVLQFKTTGVVPNCPSCGSGLMKHATVSFGQQLPPDVLQDAFALSKGAELFFAIGSSLVVEPAASLPRTAKEHGARLVIINRDSTPQDDLADIVLQQPIGVTLAAVDVELRKRIG